MALRLVAPRPGNPNYAIRGNYLHIKRLYRSSGTSKKEIAEQVLLKIEREIEAGILVPKVHEVWMQIPSCSRYEASNLGHIRRRATAGNPLTAGAILKPTPQRFGHLSVSVQRDNGRPWRASVHRLVAITFIGPPPSTHHMVCHKNGFPADCRPENLYWGTIIDNANDARRHRLHGRDGSPWNSDPYDRRRVGNVRRSLGIRQIYEIIEELK